MTDNSKFYDLMAERYEELFPQSKSQGEYLLAKAGPSPARIVDAGCATGEVCRFLHQKGYTVSGFDPDRKMIDLAQKHPQAEGIPFHCCGLENLNDYYPENSADLILVLGNVLPHILNRDTRREALAMLYAAMAPEGSVLFQVLNYQAILHKRPIELPLIRTDACTFHRIYDFSEYAATGFISFSTVLENRRTGAKTRARINLLPLQREQIETELMESGFREIRITGEFSDKPPKGNDAFIMIQARH